MYYSGYKANMTEDGIKVAKKEFEMMDRDKDGYIGTDDLINVFTEHENMSPNEAAALARIIIDQLDLSKNNKIDFDEFISSKVVRSISRSAYELFDELLHNTMSFSANAGALNGNNNNNVTTVTIDETYLCSDYENDNATNNNDEMQYGTDYATDDANMEIEDKLSASPVMAPIHEMDENSQSSGPRE